MQKTIKPILTDDDLERLQSKIANQDIRAFLNNKIYQLCRDHILPNEKEFKKKTKKVIHSFILQKMEVGESGKTNIELLNMFAKYHHMSIAKIIHLYIILPQMEEEYFKKKQNLIKQPDSHS